MEGSCVCPYDPICKKEIRKAGPVLWREESLWVFRNGFGDRWAIRERVVLGL